VEKEEEEDVEEEEEEREKRRSWWKLSPKRQQQVGEWLELARNMKKMFSPALPRVLRDLWVYAEIAVTLYSFILALISLPTQDSILPRSRIGSLPVPTNALWLDWSSKLLSTPDGQVAARVAICYPLH